MRISTQMMYRAKHERHRNSQAEWMKLGEQMSAGKRLPTHPDDPSRVVAGGSTLSGAGAELPVYGAYVCHQKY